MRFTSRRDYQTILDINRELVNIVVDTPVILFKVNATETPTNIYGESTKKVMYTGVRLEALIDRSQFSTISDIQMIDVFQSVDFSFLRDRLKEKDVYPQRGDFIQFHNEYYEIDNITETQLFAGQTAYNHSLVCACHLTRRSTIEFDKIL